MVRYTIKYKKVPNNKGFFIIFNHAKELPQHNSNKFSLQSRFDNTILYRDAKYD